MQLSGITLQNFRIFKNQTIDFKPITFLTGTNSSGKSSVFKALLLLQDNIDKNKLSMLDFSANTHALGAFSLIKNKFEPHNNLVKFEIEANKENRFFEKLDGLLFKYCFSQDVKNPNNGRLINLEVQGVKAGEKIKILEAGIDNGICIFKVNMESLLKNIGNNNDFAKQAKILMFPIRTNIKRDTIELERGYRVSKIENSIYNIEKDVTIFFTVFEKEFYDDKIKNINDLHNKIEQTNEYENEDLENIKNKINLLEEELQSFIIEKKEEYKNAYLEDLSIVNDSSKFSDKLYSEIYNKIQDLVNNGFIDIITKNEFVFEYKTGDNLIDSIINNNHWNIDIEYFVNDLMDNKLENLINWEGIEYAIENIKNIKFKEILASITIQGNSIETENYIQYLVTNSIKKIIELSYDSMNFVCLPAFRSYQTQAYDINNRKGIIENVINDYIQMGYTQSDNIKDKKVNKFIKKWLGKFEIGDAIHIEPIEDIGTSYRLKILKNDKYFNISDMGFGISQIIPIILTCASKHKNIICIEEPETNLHPKFQSLLADMFVEANKEFRIKFCLETHSEYIIRRTQYLIANQEITNEDVTIYYFNNDIEKTNQIIPIKTNGDIELNFDKYWRGFYDEATTQADKLKSVKMEADTKEMENIIKKISNKCKCVIFTEDSGNNNKLSKLFFGGVCGFNLDETYVIPYNGKDNLKSAIISIDIVRKDKPNLEYVIFHRDRDIYEGNEDFFQSIQKDISKLNNKIKYYLFLTKYYDIESYFINAKHINYLYSQISLEDAEILIKEATEFKRDISIRKMCENSQSTKILKINKTNLCDILNEVNNIYDKDIERYRYGKEVYSYLCGLIQNKIKENPKLIQRSEFIDVSELQNIAKDIWK